MFKKLFSKIVGDPQKKLISGYEEFLTEIDSWEPQLEKLTDEELREQTFAFKERLIGGETLEDIQTEAFAVVREASRRTTTMRHYDVQMMGGDLIHRGEIIEMRTGEGKTLVGTSPLYLNALSGDGVHLVTVNEYLARRDGGWMGKIFHFLGLTVAVIGPQDYSASYDPDYVHPGSALEDERLVHWRPCSRREAYLADVTYGIASEFGFDYLRDNLVSDPTKLTQRDMHFAVIDEVDNILIDEARTPLIISGPANQTGKDYERFSTYVKGLKRNTMEEGEEPDGDYDLDEKSKSVSLTEPGIAKVEERIPEINTDAGESLYDPQFFHLTYYADNAMKAQYLFRKDHQYVVQSGEVIIVDDFTGRLMPGRRYSDGLHEAIEAKEGVQIKRENVTVATITLQNYFRMYEKLAGMTGTAITDAEEFKEIYDVDVTALPTNVQYLVDAGTFGLQEKKRKRENANEIYYVKPGKSEATFFKRTDYPDQVYGNEPAKDMAIVQEVGRVHETGQPVLVGTTSVEHSEVIDQLLSDAGIPHQVLNAKIHQSEALIVSQAGRKGAVTISTNMAGRGTDILLGGNPEGLATEELEYKLFTRQNVNQLAEIFLLKGKQAAEAHAKKHSKLTNDLLPRLEALQTEYDGVMKEIGKIKLDNYLTNYLQKNYETNRDLALQLVRLVRNGQVRQARRVVADAEQDVVMVEDAARLSGLYSRYENASNDPQAKASILAELLFDTHYNGRAALIRAILEDNTKLANQIVQDVPGLTADLLPFIEKVREKSAQERKEVWALGGLHVVGSERHESRRIDNQLRGRAARQGDPGSSRFFLSVEDDLMIRFGGERLKNFMARTNIPDDMPIENSILDRLIESSQERIEGYNFDMRKNVVEYDDVMNIQRQAIYGERLRILMGEEGDLDGRVRESFDEAIGAVADNYLENYAGYVTGEIDRAIQDSTTEATDAVNVTGVLRRMRGLLPKVIELDKNDFTSGQELRSALIQLAHENEAEGTNLYQFLQAAGRFIPLVPAVPHLGNILSGRRTGHLQTRERIKVDFLKRLESLYNEFLSEQAASVDRDAIWQRAETGVNEAFNGFSVARTSSEDLVAQQPRFQEAVYNALRELLAESVSALNTDQLIEALNGYVESQQNNWRKIIGDEEYEKFLRLLLLNAIDREWRDYLTAMDDLRREIGLESIAQRDPKIEYKRRSYEMFADMKGNIDEAVAERFFRDIAGHQQFIKRQQERAKAQLSTNVTPTASGGNDGKSTRNRQARRRQMARGSANGSNKKAQKKRSRRKFR